MTSFDTAEFRRSDGPQFHGAVSAWSRGIAGAGEIVAVIDTGIDPDSPEFIGRVHPDSTDLFGSRGLEGVDDHGSNVSIVAVGARDNAGVLGIAYEAQVLALRGDTPGSCDVADPDDDAAGCSFSDSTITRGIDIAVAAGATVINLSLGGGGVNSTLRAAIARAAAAGVVIVVSAGNDGDSTDAGIDPTQPDPFGTAIREAGGDNVIIVGSVDQNGMISDFSNKAGTQGAFYLTARGERICCIYKDGELEITEENGSRFVTLFSGTSFSAPQVSGAVALLAQAFPNLTGKEIVEILLVSARDAGAAGIDEIYGRGILDIARAFEPVGTTSIAGTGSVLAASDTTATASTAMGDAFVDVALETIVTDRFDRAFGYQLGQNLRGALPQQRLRGAVENNGRHVAIGGGGVAMAFSIDESGSQDELTVANALRLSTEDAQQARVLAARVAMQIAPKTQLGVAYRETESGIVAQLQGQDRPAFMIATGAAGDTGFSRSGDASLAVRQTVGPWGLTASMQSGSAVLGNFRGPGLSLSRERERFATRSFALAADRRFGNLAATLGMNWLDEDDTVLGAYFHEALGGNGASTMFVDAGAAWHFAPGWRLGGDVRQGFSRARSGGLVAAGSDFTSRAWSFDLSRSGALKLGDSLGFRVSQPLRVSHGGLQLSLPVDYDYTTESAIYGNRALSLSPDGREMMGEIAWRGPLWNGNGALSVFYRSQPGHFAGAQDDTGMALRWNKSF
ncbi:S8 family peptidase [Alteripontixanthobacter maritimus]|uniref:S8 family peptidase n=1 Tax=Alteripontixanthobacter maritimus TaxID=2161824 RepID=UPI000E1C346D|nr:S8 family peptidase [Alteripontixanthobacter maritimus]